MHLSPQVKLNTLLALPIWKSESYQSRNIELYIWSHRGIRQSQTSAMPASQDCVKMEQTVPLCLLSPFLGQSLQGLSPVSYSSLHRLSIICCLALGLWYLKEDTYQAVRFCLNFPGSCLNFLLNFCFRDKLYNEWFPFASAVSTESLESLVINKDSWNPASGRNLYRMKYQLRDYLDVLLRPCLGSGFQKYIA